jgi:hypothetical protein
MALEGAFDRFLALAIIGFLGWMIYESRRGNKMLDRFIHSKDVSSGMDGTQFGIRKH